MLFYFYELIWAILGHSKPKIFSVAQPWWLTFFQDFAPPRPPSLLPNYFSAATALRHMYLHHICKLLDSATACIIWVSFLVTYSPDKLPCSKDCFYQHGFDKPWGRNKTTFKQATLNAQISKLTKGSCWNFVQN